MYKLILMKADYEPWWQFDDIQEKYAEELTFENYESYESKILQVLQNYREKYQYEASRNGLFYAFWNDAEVEFCEGCDEDLQVYHGIFFSHEIGIFSK